MEMLKNIPGLEEIAQSKYTRPVLQGVGLALVLGLGVWGYSAYRRSVDEAAHKAFTDALVYFDATVSDEPGSGDEMTFGTKEEKWQKVATVFKDAYASNSSAGIAPVFAAYEAQAYLELGNSVEAEKLLDSSVPHIANEALRSYYNVKLALIRLDSDSPVIVAQGLKMLEAAAAEDDQAAHAMVLFELGNWHFTKNETDQARNYLEQLDLKYGKSSQNPSQWAEKGKQKLKLISV